MTETAVPDTEAPHEAEADEHDVERRTSPVELLWDLVFVFAITQVTTLLSRHLTWAGFGRAMVILALVWWAWSAFVWVANAQVGETARLRLTLLLAAAFIFITGLAIPQAFAAEGLLFAISYAVVRFLHLALYADTSRRGDASWSAIAGFALTVTIGMALLIAGGVVHGDARVALWAAALAIDYAGPAWLTRERLRSLQRVAVAHFAERYGLFVIICLGESIVAIGVGASAARVHLSAELVATVSLGLLTTIAMWWTYFDHFAEVAEARLRKHRDPVLAAADGYSYLHLVIVAGIITFAAGVKVLVRAPSAHSPDAIRLALCGGLAAYLLGHVAFRLRIAGSIGFEKAVTAAALIALYALGNGLEGWILMTVIATVMVALCAVETAAHRRTVAARS